MTPLTAESEADLTLTLSATDSTRSCDMKAKYCCKQDDIFISKVGCLVGVGGLVVGYNFGVISGAIFPLSQAFHTGDVENGLIVSLLSIGSLCGCVVAGFVSDKIGRWRWMN